MRSLFILCFLICCCGLVRSQEKPQFLPEEVDPSSINLRCFCKPGVKHKSKSRGIEISYKYIGSSVFKSEEDELERPVSIAQSIQYFNFKIKAPILLKPRLKMIVGYTYSPQIYRFHSISDSYKRAFERIDQRLLKNNEFSILATRPWNEKYYSTLRFKASFRGDYDGWVNFSDRYAVYNLIGVFGIKKSDYVEWAVGLSFAHSFRRTGAFPFLVFNKTFNERWGIETVLPGRIMGRYNWNDRTIMLFGAEYSSRSYSVDVMDEALNTPVVYNLNHSGIRALASLDRQIAPWVWGNVKFGYQKNFNTEFDNRLASNQSFEVDQSNPLFFQVGIFISPPDKFMK